MFLGCTDECEILQIVNLLCSNDLCACNGMSMVNIKTIVKAIVKPLTFICNQSFLTGIFPHGMKIARAMPIFKSGEKNIFSNHRPISILPQLSIIVEFFYKVRLSDFICKNKILNESIYGFRTGRSTSLVILDLIEYITDEIDKGKSTIGVFIDLKKLLTQLTMLCFKKNCIIMAYAVSS